MSAEDLTTLAGVSVQQDLALVSLLGLGHVERNGHHFIDGMSFAPEGEQEDFVRAHPISTTAPRPGAPAHPRGRLALGSLACPGFAVAAEMDFAAMRQMPPHRGAHRTRNPEKPHERAALASTLRDVAELEDCLSEPTAEVAADPPRKSG